jgi:hypothetical protein
LPCWIGRATAIQVAEKAVTLAYKHALWYMVKPNIVMVVGGRRRCVGDKEVEARI